MKKNYVVISLLLCFLSFAVKLHNQSTPDALSMEALKASIKNSDSLGWDYSGLSRRTNISSFNTPGFVYELSPRTNSIGWPSRNFTRLMRLSGLKILSLTNNHLTGIVPLSLSKLPSHTDLYLGGNLLQGPVPEFDNPKVHSDIKFGFNNFCLDAPGVSCDTGYYFVVHCGVYGLSTGVCRDLERSV
ncbi:hypothetical protein Patl1_15614 [Pistacia atlantica]|uniref:Uncharacterized protein n=1 Tax=Pistacia atlantica TaxID=434234 RepID=A0ACC1B5B5_9ROSI|nr:hypothetical protein Patl1_15614 [Pistacia atlantica]